MDTAARQLEILAGTGDGTETGRPTFALALGGGGARGLAHIHVAEVLDELGIRPVAIAGSSIGAIVGAGIASGMSGREIEDHALFVLARRIEVVSRMWRTRPATFGEMLENGLRVTQFDIKRILRAFLPDRLPMQFEDLAIPLQVTATDFYDRSQIVFESGDLFQAMAASAAIPAVFRPILHEGRLLVDGGIVNPVPFDLLRGKADIIIAIDVVGAPKANGKPPTSLELVLGASQIMMQSIIALKLQSTQPHILLRPPVSHIGVLDFLKVRRVLTETLPIRDELKRAIEAAIAGWQPVAA